LFFSFKEIKTLLNRILFLVGLPPEKTGKAATLFYYLAPVL